MIDAQGTDYSGYTRTAMNELQLRFPGVANKQVLLYVYPHPAGQTRASTAIVPGYATFFWLLPDHTYALPGERQWFDSAVQ
jgi:conjugative transfer region lipoprotein (TIGR03751 family)